MTALQWGTPPPDSRKARDWATVASQLRARPGEWAKVLEAGSGSYATQIKKGGLACFRPAGSFEATTRLVSKNPNKFDIWARYVEEPAA